MIDKTTFWLFLKENIIHGVGNDQHVKIKNTDKNEPIIEVKLDLSPNSNGWSLGGDLGLFIDFKWAKLKYSEIKILLWETICLL